VQLPDITAVYIKKRDCSTTRRTDSSSEGAIRRFPCTRAALTGQENLIRCICLTPVRAASDACHGQFQIPLWAPTINVPNSGRFTVHSRRYALSAVATHLLYSHGRPLSAYSGPFNGKQFIVTALIITFLNMLFGSRDAFGTSLQEECLLTRSPYDSEYSRPSHRYTVAPTSVPDAAVCASKAPLIFEANTLYSGKTYPT